MSSLFGGGSPTPPPPPPPPTQDDASVQAAAAEERKRRQLAQGRASTILAGEVSDEPETARKKLLGS